MIVSVFVRRLKPGASFQDFVRGMYEVRTEHDFSHVPQQIDIGSSASLLAALI